MTRSRIDQLLVAKGLFESRAKAQEAIAAGLVIANGKLVRKPSETLEDTAEITASAPYPWVSRGGLKLVAALDAFGFDPKNRTCLDVGSSTGGFTHVLLDRGAARVYAIDVGHDQLHHSLRSDARVESREGTDARRLSAQDFTPLPDLIVCDASFISLKLVLAASLALAPTGAELAALIKPQFEVGPNNVVKGIVKDKALAKTVCRDIEKWLNISGWQVVGQKPSPITGGDGNHEFLIGAVKL